MQVTIAIVIKRQNIIRANENSLIVFEHFLRPHYTGKCHKASNHVFIFLRYAYEMFFKLFFRRYNEKNGYAYCKDKRKMDIDNITFYTSDSINAFFIFIFIF